MSLVQCFVTPALPLTGRSLPRPHVSTTRSTRTVPTAMLRFPNGPLNPFNFSRGSPSGRNFFSSSGGQSGNDFGSGSGGGGSSGSGKSSDSGGNFFSNIWAAYNSRLDQNPIATKAFTSFFGFLIGDLLAQKFLGEKGTEIDLARLARMASFGFLIHGPTGHYFYGFLDRLLVGTSPIKVAAKVAIDQVLWAPIFTVAFFTYLGATERKTIDDIKNKIKNDTWIGVKTSWKFWPIAHAVNFGFIPSSQRLLYINTLQVGYNIILSILGNK